MKRPTETQCPVCPTIFQQPRREQGGGRLSIYCSAKCRSLDWVRGNGAKRKAAILKYGVKPENKLQKQERTRQATLKRYNWSEDDFQQCLWRQNGKCLGCQNLIDRYSARIDHNHTTGKTRGLLCDNCNWTVGHAKDNPAILRNLAAYLEHS